MSETPKAHVDDGIEVEESLVEALFSSEARRDPHPFFRSVSLPGCRYAVADRMLRDGRFGARLSSQSVEPLWQLLDRWLIYIDGERHAQLRRRFAGLFVPRRVEAFRDVVTQRAQSLVARARARGEMDLVVEFARPLPFSVIVEILGVPEDHWDWIEEQMVVVGQGFARQLEQDFVARASTAAVEVLDYYAELLDDRAAHPRDDLLSALAADMPEDEDGRRDLIANCFFFVEAGHATTTSLISAGTLLLLEHPDQLSRLRNDPGLVSSAIEEMLRLISPVTVAQCRAREDVDIDGYHFPTGVTRFAFLAAANRDPDAFPDPDTFDIARAPNRNLAFGAGPHFCLGAPLARLHGEIAIPTLIRELPNLRLAGEPVWRGAFPLRELDHLPLAWDVP